MKIKELIEKLQKLENKEAEINIIIGNEDGNVFSSCDVELFQDTSDSNYQILYCDEKTNQE